MDTYSNSLKATLSSFLNAEYRSDSSSYERLGLLIRRMSERKYYRYDINLVTDNKDFNIEVDGENLSFQGSHAIHQTECFNARPLLDYGYLLNSTKLNDKALCSFLDTLLYNSIIDDLDNGYGYFTKNKVEYDFVMALKYLNWVHIVSDSPTEIRVKFTDYGFESYLTYQSFKVAAGMEPPINLSKRLALVQGDIAPKNNLFSQIWTDESLHERDFYALNPFEIFNVKLGSLLDDVELSIKKTQQFDLKM